MKFLFLKKKRIVRQKPVNETGLPILKITSYDGCILGFSRKQNEGVKIGNKNAK